MECHICDMQVCIISLKEMLPSNLQPTTVLGRDVGHYNILIALAVLQISTQPT